MRTKITTFVSILFVLLSTSCSDNTEVINKELELIEPCKDIVLSRSQQDIVDSQARFAFDFFKETSAWIGQENMVISPLSLSIDLAMLANGAGDDTYNDIAKAIKLPDTTPDELNALYKTLVDELLEADSRVDLSISNGMWNDKDVNIKDAFATTIKDNYNANIQTLDFNNETTTKNLINQWASEKTKGNITDLFKDDNISNSKFILCNAVYFNGKWTFPFEKELTKKISFINIDNSQSDVETMVSVKEGFLFGSTETADIIELAYGNRAYSMYVILPKVEDQIPHEIQYNKFIDGIDLAWWKATKKDMMYYPLEVFLPKFKIETKCPDIGLTTLTELSSIIFSHDMKNMTDSEIGRLKINQYNTIEVSENGTTATSVSEVSGGITSAFNSEFIVDRPFIFLIEEQSTGAILFIGKVVKL